MTAESADATVIITTKNRKDDLRKAIASAVMQDAQPHVLVIDDGSTDGTSEMVCTEFPTVQLERMEQSRGLIVQRNHGAALVHSPLIFSIDDDAVFTTPRIVSQTIAEFQNPRIGAVAMPFVDINYGDTIRQMAPDDREIYVASSYIGTAHALRRELFLRLGGYRAFLFHQGEEEDYCIRMMEAGYIVRLGRADPIHHFESPKRDFRRRDVFGRRNTVLFVWCNVPLIYLPFHLLGTTIKGMRAGIQVRRFRQMTYGLLVGYASIFRYWRERRPVSIRVYRIFRRLRGQTNVQMPEVEKWIGGAG
jgi:glycosyltransferase involved in cell wall biosynthesis